MIRPDQKRSSHSERDRADDLIQCTMKSIHDGIKFASSLITATFTASGNGSAVDTMGYNDAEVVINAGVIDLASANETYAFSVEESADGSTGWTAISGATATVTANNQTKTIRVGKPSKRYIRAVLTAGGTTPSILCGAIVALGNAFRKPVGNV